MDWNRGLLVIGQIVALIVLGAMVCLGHNSAVTDALLVITGSLAGTGVYQAVKGKTSSAATK